MLSAFTISRDTKAGSRLQRRSHRLLVGCLVASIALHAVLLFELPGFVERQAPLEVHVLDVVLLKPQPPAAAETAPPAATPPGPAPVPEKRRTANRETASPTPARPQSSRSPEKESRVPLPEPPAVAQGVPQSPAEATPEARSASEAGSVTARAGEAREITPPTFNAAYLRNPAPRYPLVARRNGEQGTVTLRVLVLRDGVPASVSVERTSGSGRLDNAALETVKSWRFVPARRGDTPVEAWVLVPIVFRLEGTS